MWYRRTCTVPADGRIGSGKRLKLNFGAVDWRTEVYVNGTEVAEHTGGYDKFSADITDALQPGRTQELIVGVDDPTDAADGEDPPVQQSYVDVDPATCTDDYLTRLDEVRALVCRGGNGAVYTQITDVE